MSARYRRDREHTIGDAPQHSTIGLSQPTQRRQQILSLAAVHRVLTPQLLQRAYPWLYAYSKKAKRDLDSLCGQNAQYKYFLKYKSKYKFYSDVYIITQKGYEACVRNPDVDNAIIPVKYSPPIGNDILHELSITETAVRRYGYVRNNSGVEILEEGRFSLLGNIIYSKSERQKLRKKNRKDDQLRIFDDIVPDYWYLKRDGNGMMFRCEEHFVGEASGTRIKEKLLEYFIWEQRPDVQQFLIALYKKHGATNPLPAYEVHCVLESRDFQHTDEDKERITMMQTFQIPPEMQGKVWMTTSRAINEAMDTGVGFNFSIWHRGRDMIDMRGRFERTSGRGRTRSLTEWMAELETYPLFA